MSNTTWVCFDCQLAVRRDKFAATAFNCAHCGRVCVDLGHRIPTPRKGDPTYCISRYQTYYFAIAAVVCALGSFVCGGNRSIALRFVVVIGAPALLLGAWYWSSSQWAGGDDGPGFAWGFIVGGAAFFNSLLYFATFVALWAQMSQRNRTP